MSNNILRLIKLDRNMLGLRKIVREKYNLMSCAFIVLLCELYKQEYNYNYKNVEPTEPLERII
jgi:hypothetical protein